MAHETDFPSKFRVKKKSGFYFSKKPEWCVSSYAKSQELQNSVFFFFFAYFQETKSLLLNCKTVLLLFFLYGPFLKSLLNWLHYCFCFIVLTFLATGMQDLRSWPGIKPIPLTLESEVLTTGPPGKKLNLHNCILQ